MKNPRASYWAVIWADDKMAADKHPEVLRTTFDKFVDPKDACNECFGMFTHNMWVKNLGTSVAPLRVFKKRSELLDPKSDGWCLVGDYGKKEGR